MDFFDRHGTLGQNYYKQYPVLKIIFLYIDTDIFLKINHKVGLLGTLKLALTTLSLTLAY